jgi:hypothetical protein
LDDVAQRGGSILDPRIVLLVDSRFSKAYLRFMKFISIDSQSKAVSDYVCVKAIILQGK